MAGILTSAYVAVNWMFAFMLPPPDTWNYFINESWNALGSSISSLSTGGKQ